MKSKNSFLYIILGLCLVGILASGYLLSIHVRYTSGQAGLTESCSIIPGLKGQGCAAVAVSDYSDVFGIPLAAIAMGYYFTQLILVFWAMRNQKQSLESLYVSFFLSTLAVVVTVVMFSISKFVLMSFCSGCAVLWLVNLSIWPALVKQLNLSWGNALAANLELARPGKQQLQKGRIQNSFVVGIVCMVIFIIVGAVASKQSTEESKTGDSTILAEFNQAPQVFLPAEAYGGTQSKGVVPVEGKAPVMDIVEFADFQCPACRMAAQFFKPFVLKHHDKVRLTFRNFPLDGSCNPHAPNGSHALSCQASRAALCAAKQDKFFALHDQIYDHQEELTSSMIDELAEKAGLDMSAYSSCKSQKAVEDQLKKDMDWGEVIQLESTPTIIVNGRKMTGARSPADLEILLKYLSN